MGPRALLFVLFAISVVGTFVFFAVPFLSPYGSFTHLDGTPGILDHWDAWSECDPLTMITYTIGDMICHQQMARTFILNGSEMPVCVRDVGLLMGFMIGSLIVAVFFGNPVICRYARPYVVISFILIFIDWTIQHIFDLNIQFTRMTTGLLAGAGFSLIIYCWAFRIFHSEKETDGP